MIKYPADLMKLIKIKRKACKKWLTIKYQGDKAKFNRLNNLLKKRIREAEKQDSFREFINKLTMNESTDYSLWKLIKNLKRPQIQKNLL